MRANTALFTEGTCNMFEQFHSDLYTTDVVPYMHLHVRHDIAKLLAPSKTRFNTTYKGRGGNQRSRQAQATRHSQSAFTVTETEKKRENDQKNDKQAERQK